MAANMMNNLTALGMNPGFGSMSPLGSMAGLGVQDPQSAMMSSMLATMGMLMGGLMTGATPSLAAGLPAFGSNLGSGTPGLGNFLGLGSGAQRGGSVSRNLGSSKSRAGASSDAGASSGSGAKAVDIAKKYLGKRSGQITNMKNFSRAGGVTNNCADFVSACLANAGTYKKQPGDASVATLKQNLLKQGWKKVGKEQSKPGDVAVFNGSQHVELVSKKGAKQLIGSNNNGQSFQTVTTNTPNWGSVEYFSKG